MSDRLQNALILISVLGCGLVGGVFFAFSSFVMGALARLPTAQGIAAMQSINVVVINPVFLGVFLGMGATCSALMVTGLRSAFGPRELWIIAAGILYLAGSVLVTMLCNVPRNDTLAVLDPRAAEAASAWARYVSEWTLWNHVRAAASIGAAACLMVAWR